MVRKAKPIQRYPISVEIDGKTYSGSYSISGKVITVSYMGARKAPQVGGSGPDTIGRMLLRELVRGG